MFKKAMTLISIIILAGCATFGNTVGNQDETMEHFRIKSDTDVVRYIVIEPPWITQGEDTIMSGEDTTYVDVRYIIETHTAILMNVMIDDEAACMVIIKYQPGFIELDAESVPIIDGLTADCVATDELREELLDVIENNGV